MLTLKKVSLSFRRFRRATRANRVLSANESQEVTGIDNDVRGKYNQYNQVKTQLMNLEKKQT